MYTSLEHIFELESVCLLLPLTNVFVAPAQQNNNNNSTHFWFHLRLHELNNSLDKMNYVNYKWILMCVCACWSPRACVCVSFFLIHLLAFWFLGAQSTNFLYRKKNWSVREKASHMNTRVQSTVARHLSLYLKCINMHNYCGIFCRLLFILFLPVDFHTNIFLL